MALNIKTLGVRSLTALVFVVVLLGAILFSYTTFTILFFIICMGGLYEFFKISEKLSSKPFKVTGYITAAIIYVTFVLRTHLFLPGFNIQLEWLPIAAPFI